MPNPSTIPKPKSCKPNTLRIRVWKNYLNTKRWSLARSSWMRVSPKKERSSARSWRKLLQGKSLISSWFLLWGELWRLACSALGRRMSRCLWSHWQVRKWPPPVTSARNLSSQKLCSNIMISLLLEEDKKHGIWMTLSAHSPGLKSKKRWRKRGKRQK